MITRLTTEACHFGEKTSPVRKGTSNSSGALVSNLGFYLIFIVFCSILYIIVCPFSFSHCIVFTVF
jgi:hypothetical protein